ncbi:hypothetical protein M0G43_09300 [Subsaxibacter sp. CAU 1640]|uniref:hypothetical protein n=1 Tax=Subsaxibacter sp. CAU 1640 TaxID=2933271 RepID=UPI002005C299|nr:hypothetical protein [Subsaxibacter sp. CAU 1640]MCK7590769.1 hypothetical protein [Subsaxibacter sp. CAU 1640]
MRTKHIFTLIVCLFIGFSSEAQILKKLKKKAEQAAERTILRKTDEAVSKKTEKTIDDATKKRDTSDDNASEESTSSEGDNTALEKHKNAKQSFYREDVVIKLHENGKLNQTQYFDADAVAVRSVQNDMPKPNYVDSEGFIYGFKDGEYTKSSIVALQSQGMMMPTMMLEAYKLPPEPFMAQLQKQQDMGMTANPFNGIVEFAFIYKPDDFRYEDFKESKQTLRGKRYTKFEYLNEPGYEGSYVLFDDNGRLVEIYTKKTDTGNRDALEMGNMLPPGESVMVYDYQPVDVTLPKAREVRMQGQGLMEMVMGNANGSANSGSKDIDEDDYDTSDSKGMTKSVRNSIKNHKVSSSDLPSTYDFDWIYETEMHMGKNQKDNMGMNFLIKDGASYQATQMVDEKTKDMGNATMLFDADLKTMVMFMDANGTNYMQLYPIPDVKESTEKMDYKITELPSKTVLGYNCKGLQMEDDRYVFKVYHTSQAPIALSNFMNFSGAKNIDLPDIDPRIIEQFSKGLIMEMHMEDKKKSKNNVSITAKKLTKQSTSIHTKDYKNMNFFGMNKN